MTSSWTTKEHRENAVSMRVLVPQGPKNSIHIPMPRSGHRMVADDSYLYSMGGLVQTGYVRDNQAELIVEPQLHRFHLVTQKWEHIEIKPAIPSLTASHAVCKIGGLLFIHGGTGLPFGHEIENNVYTIDLDNGLRKCIQCTPKDGKLDNFPIPAYGQSLTPVAVNALGEYRIFRIFGTVGVDYLSHVYCLHWPSAVWELLWVYTSPASLPPHISWILPRYRHSAFLVDTDIWIVGGAPIANAEPNFTTIDIFKTLSSSWDQVHCDVSRLDPQLIQEGMPVFHSASKLGSYIYFLGGIDPLGSITTVSNKIFVLHLHNRQWHYLATWPSPSYFAAICEGPVGDEIYLFGGLSRPGELLQRNNELWELRVPFHNVCSLKELAWRRLSYLVQQYIHENRSAFDLSDFITKTIQSFHMLRPGSSRKSTAHSANDHVYFHKILKNMPKSFLRRIDSVVEEFH